MNFNNDLLSFINAKERDLRILTKNIINTKYRFKFNELKTKIDEFLECDGEYYDRLVMMPGLRGVGKTTILYQLYEYLTCEKI